MDKIASKLGILADAAKYDASCASGGAGKRKAGKDDKGIGSLTGGSGICHSFTPDGRCVSLLKILMTNYCMYDCAYCINRISSNVQRARFTVEEVVDLTLGFYKRNYIEGLFLSSGIIKSPDYTMESMVRIAKSLRIDHGFMGYIHLKTIPNASPALQAEAGLYADRLSINVEMPTPAGLKQFAPEKNLEDIGNTMDRFKDRIAESKAERKAPKFAPGGQSTQMIVGADATTDKGILTTSNLLYTRQKLRRVYYSAFSPIPDSHSLLPAQAAPLLREHRLYQADWLLRFYEFTLEDILSGQTGDMLTLDYDPKVAWAIAHREFFPLDINRAPRESLLRIPGMGVRTVNRIVSLRRHQTLGWSDLAKMRLPMNRLKPFIVTRDYRPAPARLDSVMLPTQMRQNQLQLDLFAR